MPNTLFLGHVEQGMQNLMKTLLSSMPFLQQLILHLQNTLYHFNKSWRKFQLEECNLYPLFVEEETPALKVLHFYLERYQTIRRFYREHVQFLWKDEEDDTQPDQYDITTIRLNLFLALFYVHFTRPMQMLVLCEKSTEKPWIQDVFPMYWTLCKQWNMLKKEDMSEEEEGAVVKRLLNTLDANVINVYNSFSDDEQLRRVADKCVMDAVFSLKKSVQETFGDIDLCLNRKDQLRIQFKHVGQWWSEQAMRFFFVASYCDPNMARRYAIVPSLRTLERALPWKLPDGHTIEQLHDELQQYIQSLSTAILPKEINLLAFWKSALKGRSSFDVTIGPVLAHVGYRIITKRSGSPQMDLPVSISNTIDESFAHAAFIRSRSQALQAICRKKQAKKLKHMELRRYKIKKCNGEVVSIGCEELLARRQKMLQKLKSSQ